MAKKPTKVTRKAAVPIDEPQITPHKKVLEQMVQAAKVNVPFVCITTHDPNRLVDDATEAISAMLTEQKGTPLTAVRWDISRGIYGKPGDKPYDVKGREWVATLTPQQEESGAYGAAFGEPGEPTGVGVGQPTVALEAFCGVPKQTIVFFYQSDRWLDASTDSGKAAIQAAANLRNRFKSVAQSSMIVFLAPVINLPHELRADTIMLDDPLPQPVELEILFENHKVLGEAVPKPADRRRAAAHVTGCSWFGAEQILYLGLRRDTKSNRYMDMEEVRSLRHNQIEQIRGLSVIRCASNFNAVAGNHWIKNRLTRIFHGNNPPNGIVNVEEINWAMSGARGDNTGISQDQVGTILDHMETHGDRGIIFFGVPGCSKSWLVQTAGRTFGVDALKMDLNAMKQGEVGSSESNIREALKVADAVTGGNKLWIATCNSVAGLDEALLRRFTYGIVYFDLPSDEEKFSVWPIQLSLNKVQASEKEWQAIDTNLWSAADIRNCCRDAYDLKMSVSEASDETNPVARQDPHMLVKYRRTAHQCYRCANTGRLYIWDKAPNKDQAVPEEQRAVLI